LFVVMTIVAFTTYWVLSYREYRRALESCWRTQAAFEAGRGTALSVCEKSLAVYRAQVRVPFFDHGKAANDHLYRVYNVRKKFTLEAQVSNRSRAERDALDAPYVDALQMQAEQ
jgi:hypothetical protein